MKKIDKLRQRHKKEIEELQSKCKHKKSLWMDEHWAPGHSTGRKVNVCLECDKIIASKGILE